MRQWCGMLCVLVAVACSKWVPYQPRSVSVTEDPDRLYAAAVRVILNRGWGFANRDPKALAVETDWIEYDGIPQYLAHRLLVRDGAIDLFTSCSYGGFGGPGSGQKCDAKERPKGTIEIEDALVRDILAEAKKLGAGEAGADRPTTPAVDPTACIEVCGTQRRECAAPCGHNERCRNACSDDYRACVQACK